MFRFFFVHYQIIRILQLSMLIPQLGWATMHIHLKPSPRYEQVDGSIICKVYLWEMSRNYYCLRMLYFFIFSFISFFIFIFIIFYFYYIFLFIFFYCNFFIILLFLIFFYFLFIYSKLHSYNILEYNLKISSIEKYTLI